MIHSKTDDIIIIDDECSIVELLEAYCENLGLFRHIIKAYDGSEASKKLSNQNFALIILDINMPKKSGVDLIKEFERKGHPNFLNSVIIISGEINKDILSESLKRGVKNFIVKPFSEEQFSEKVRETLKLSRPDLLI